MSTSRPIRMREKIPVTARGMRKHIEWLEREAQIKETIAGMLKREKDGVVKGEHYTHTQAQQYLWSRRGYGENLEGGAAGWVVILPIIAAVHALALPFVGISSATRARRGDPEIFFNQIAGKIWLSNLSHPEKEKLVDLKAQDLMREAEDLRNIAGEVRDYYKRKFGKEHEEPAATELEREFRKMRGVNRVFSPENPLFTHAQEEIEKAEKILDFVRKNKEGIINGEVDEAPAGLWHYNDHLIAINEARNREEALDEFEKTLDAKLKAIREMNEKDELLQNLQKSSGKTDSDDEHLHQKN